MVFKMLKITSTSSKLLLLLLLTPILVKRAYMWQFLMLLQVLSRFGKKWGNLSVHEYDIYYVHKTYCLYSDIELFDFKDKHLIYIYLHNCRYIILNICKMRIAYSITVSDCIHHQQCATYTFQSFFIPHQPLMNVTILHLWHPLCCVTLLCICLEKKRKLQSNICYQS